MARRESDQVESSPSNEDDGSTQFYLPLYAERAGIRGFAKLFVDPSERRGRPWPWRNFSAQSVISAYEELTGTELPLTADSIRWRDEDQNEYSTVSGASAQLLLLLCVAMHLRRRKVPCFGGRDEVWASGTVNDDGHLGKVSALKPKLKTYIETADPRRAVFFVPSQNMIDLGGLAIESRPLDACGRCFSPSERHLVVVVPKKRLRILLRVIEGVRPAWCGYLMPMVAMLLCAAFAAWAFTAQRQTAVDAPSNRRPPVAAAPALEVFKPSPSPPVRSSRKPAEEPPVVVDAPRPKKRTKAAVLKNVTIRVSWAVERGPTALIYTIDRRPPQRVKVKPGADSHKISIPLTAGTHTIKFEETARFQAQSATISPDKSWIPVLLIERHLKREDLMKGSMR